MWAEKWDEAQTIENKIKDYETEEDFDISLKTKT